MGVMMGVVDHEAEHRALVARLFRTSYGELVGLATLVTGDREVGEDVAQDAFARLRRRAVADRARPVPVAGAVAPTEDAALAGDDARAVAAALSRLPLRQRECVAACTLLGLSHTEAAAVLGISAGSVKTHVHRGTRRLAGLLADRAPHEHEEDR
jgi:DNA-directed RNA polymerase specialized sigma24 family protein